MELAASSINDSRGQLEQTNRQTARTSDRLGALLPPVVVPSSRRGGNRSVCSVDEAEVGAQPVRG